MRGYFCVDCGKEVPATIKDNSMLFHCSCNGMYKRFAYFREIENENDFKLLKRLNEK